jgi:hypothetical protein
MSAPNNNAPSYVRAGGFVDDMWVHFMLSVERAGAGAGADASPHAIKVYVDGGLVRPWHIGYPVYTPHTIVAPGGATSGAQSQLSAGTPEEMVAACNTACAGSNYFAMAGADTCWCGDLAASVVDADAARCDPDGDGAANCGVGGNKRSCRGVLAVYETISSTGSWVYAGCKVDSGSWGSNMMDTEANVAYSNEPHQVWRSLLPLSYSLNTVRCAVY